MFLHRLSSLFVLALLGCGSGMHVAQPHIAQPKHELTPLNVGQPQSVYISCILDIRCRISWHDDDPFSNSIAIIYRHTVDDFDTATEIGREAFFASYTDTEIETGTRYYYWVVFEDENGERGPVSNSAFNSQCVRSLTVSTCASPPDTEPEPDLEVQRLLFPRETSIEHYQTVKQSLLATEAQQAPVYHDGVHLFIGVDQGTGVLKSMKAAGSSQSSSITTVVTPTGSYQTSVTSTRQVSISKRGDWDIRRGYFDERQDHGGAAELLSGYLRESAQLQRLEVPVVMRFNTAPVVRFGGVATGEDASRLIRAVQLVNAALPLEWRLQMPQGVPTPAPEPETQEGIYVEFMPQSDYDSEDPMSLGYAQTAWLPDGSIPYATVKINKAYRSGGERQAVTVLAHELIHTLGIGHVPSSYRTVMAPEIDVSAEDMPLSILYPMDRQALRALYGHMQNGDSVTAFGAWANTTTHLVGNSDYAAFGVAFGNGYGEPWAYGYLPAMDLGDNPDLAGEATWTGLLLGFTPDEAPVAGDAELGINLDDLTGQADFTSLESWAAGETPGDVSTGAVWGDGDLAYSIAVTGNTFKQTGGDDGLLTGAFFGESHEGMGGTLEREDLTAAFGGQR